MDIEDGGSILLRSMTGYGRGEAFTGGKKLTIELKAVNHRFCEVVVRSPKNMLQVEDRIKRNIKNQIFRGRIDCYIYVEEAGRKNIAVKVDMDLVLAYYKAMKEILDNLVLSQDIRLGYFLDLPGVFVVEEAAEDIEEIWPAIEKALDEAISACVNMRKNEGCKLQEDIQGHIDRIEQLNLEIEGRAPSVVEEYRERLNQRIQALVPDGAIDPVRLLGEVALYAEHSNIAEETVRIHSHLQQLRLCCSEDGQVGRKLDFLVQELNREINTIASKAGDLRISQIVVEVKSELEKIREQIQNIE